MILSYVGTYVRLQCRERPAAENITTFKRRKHQHLHRLHTIHNITAGIFCRVCLSGPFVQPHSMWLHVAAKPCIKIMIVRLFLLHLFANTKSEIWIISHCLGLGHDTMVCAVSCYSSFDDLSNIFWNSFDLYTCDSTGVACGRFLLALWYIRLQ